MASRIFVIRHGETEWSKEERHTGSTDIPLTESGEQEVKATANAWVGQGKLIQPKNICRVYCSPRARARQTLDLLGLGIDSGSISSVTPHPTLCVTENLREWGYGDYEGLTIAEVRKLRNSRGLDKDRPWNIWRDGCEGGVSPEAVSHRLDELIKDMKRFTKGPQGRERAPDIVCIAHGHILSALALRWAEQPLSHGMRFLIQTAGVGILCFEHDDLNEPAVLLGASGRHWTSRG
ncbi:histidine phosphatase superfamily [Paecilomyces variotii]|uniref:Histidine phosphatase superfamily n=1 Tax=Byssochlamys spectabilis TaxID=264951 RepID=A0A443I3P1_BYSSP|nr:histidine phosphatase superfamily [Paecilomyces variotii]KAJ9363484.1 hypothetical protein DTO280E4_2466 [Paecilomyces variotii]RWQ98647.1 histidine phosphatase superfamily [Paecilomyces variotii]